ncbi:uncharacterized protein LOC120652413 [Panicum virgatum]|uniref:uncharacterized protein LOC120652413 n=1 Tax=Panicum virgatum TaxID=38727 RepID=UPI0019D6191D|nr:uncharacterized protein LOC120652413 [Panicum virgatum]
MANRELENESECDGSPPTDLPPLAAAAVAADLAFAQASGSRSPGAQHLVSPTPHAGSASTGGVSDSTPDWLHFSASSSDEDSPRSFLAHQKGKQVASPQVEERHTLGSSGFVADARRAPSRFMADARRCSSPSEVVVARTPPTVDTAAEVDGWVEVRRRWRRQVRQPRTPPRPVLADLVGRCFNYLARDHVAAVCRFPSRCLKCGWEGHQARFCKRGRALRGGVRWPLPARLAASHPRPLQPSVAAISHGAGPSRRGRSPASDSTRSARSQSTGRALSLPEICVPSPFRDEGPPAWETLPSPASSPKPLGDPSRRPRSELCFIPHSQEVDDAEARLSSCALVAIVGGHPPFGLATASRYAT